MKAYFISGLGADETIFRKIKLPYNYTLVHLPWTEPVAKESMTDYAKRMCEKIDTEENFILIGLSLGGMIATEMNKFVKPKKTILISSASTRKELPFWIRHAGNLKLHSLVPLVVNKNKNALIARFIGAKNKAEINHIATMRKKSSKDFSVWAIKEIISWQNKQEPEDMIHLHGTADRLLTFHKNQKTIAIKNGTHFMVYNKAAEINQLLKKYLS